jgi:acyl carrier protein
MLHRLILIRAPVLASVLHSGRYWIFEIRWTNRRVPHCADADMAQSHADRYERDTIEILKRLSRRPIEPAPDKELMADLGFDSLQILEFVGELEDHFNIAVPLNSLTHIRTVGQIVAEVRTLASAEPGTAS